MTDEEIANLCITLIHQAIFMLFKLLEHMQERFVKEGGIKEIMYKARTEYRNEQKHLSSQQNQIIQSKQSTQSNQNNQNYQSDQISINNQNLHKK